MSKPNYLIPVADTASATIPKIGEAPNLLPREASEYLERIYGIRRKVATLTKIRCVSSDGPVFIRVNRSILYPRAGLDEYANSILSKPMRSTSDAVAA